MFAFSNIPSFCRRVVEAGAAGVVVDWERRGKHRRQAGANTEINGHTAADLAAVRAATLEPGRVLCRVNRWSPSTRAEIETAVDGGADEILLPMVRRPQEVDAALEAVDGRCGLGILVETTHAVGRVAELSRRPLARVYVGLNDLMIDRRRRSLFEPLVDGTVDDVAAAVAAAGIPFGVAGLTVPEGGYPVASRLLMGALARAGASFTFLRRSFFADMVGRDVEREVPRIIAAVGEARMRDAAAVASDHAELAERVAAVGAAEQDEVVA